MRKSIKAVLLSALVFPGAGHFSLKKPVQGSLLVGIVLICLYFIFSKVSGITQDLSAKIQNGEMAYDVDKITEVVTEKLSGSGDQIINIAGLILIICWIVGILDSLRIGHLQDKNSASSKT